jgi:Leucine-rich repeat (LRR) protein
MRMLDFKSICALARCNRRLKGDAKSRFALATQGIFIIKEISQASQSAGLLRYHPNVHILGPWDMFKWFPDAIIHNMVSYSVIPPINFSKDADLEEILLSARRLRKLSFSLTYISISAETATRLFKVLIERERVDGVCGLQMLHIDCKLFNRVAIDALVLYVTNSTSLETLTAGYCNFNYRDDFLDKLADGLVKNKNIRSLNLCNCNLGKNPEVALSKILRGCPNLSNLNLVGTEFGSRDGGQLAVIAAAIMDDNCKLQSLNIASNQLIYTSGSALTPIMSKISSLNAVFCTNYRINCLRDFGRAIGASKTLTRINFAHNKIDTEIEAFSAGLALNKSLQVLSLDTCSIGTAELLILKNALVGKSELCELDLSSNSIDDAGCQYVAEILASCPSLQVLELGGNNISSDGVRTIAAAFPFTRSLQKFTIFSLRVVIDDASVSALFDAAHDHPSLTFIYASSRSWSR